MPFFTHNQKRLHYIEQGQGPLLIVLPGNTASSAHHQGDLEFYSRLGYHAVSLDFHGTGQSDRIAGPWPLDWFEQNAHDCAALIQHLGGAPSVVTGTSGGAIVAVLTAIHHPTLVQALIADSEGRLYPPKFFEQTLQADRRRRTSGQVWFWSDGHGQDWEAVVDADTDFLLRLEAANPEGIDLYQGRLREIHCSTLFTCSITDDLVPFAAPQMLEMAQQVSGSWYFTSNTGAHPFMWSCPDAFRAIARDFLAALK